MNNILLAEFLQKVQIIDCSHTITSQSPFWPGGQALEKTILRSIEKDGFAKEIFLIGDDLGTHVDSPSHFIKGSKTISDIDVQKLVCIGAIIDVSIKVRDNDDYLLTIQDIKQWEEKNGKIPNNAIVCMKTGWAKRFSNEKEYQNIDKQGQLHYPAFSNEAAEFLVKKRNINAIGIDTLSTDSSLAQDAPVHNVMLGAGKYQIENLNLTHVIAPTVLLIVMPMKIEGAPESEARVIALVSNNE